jgi:hypothetical protein
MDANGDFKTGSTPAVVPGAAPALAKAGVGGYNAFMGIQTQPATVKMYFMQ